MKVATYNLEPNIVNTALMQVWQYHKQNGDTVEHYNHLLHYEYDLIYAFSIFSWTPKNYVTKDMICGGTGFDVHSKLPAEIEACNYDYSAYPECDYSIIWFSRGCIRSCPFCVVREKEGNIKPVDHKNLNPNGKHIKVMDNNFFANPLWRSAIEKLIEWDLPVDFQGVDARILTGEQCESLNRLKHFKQIKIAWDDPYYNMIPKLEDIVKHVRPYRLMCYVLIGYNSTPEQDMYRIESLRSLKIDPFVMPFNKKDKYQRNLARWVNHKAIFKSVPWAQYKHVEPIVRKEKVFV